MGFWLTNNHIEIANKTIKNGVITRYSYKEIDDNFINEIVGNTKILYIQISEK